MEKLMAKYCEGKFVPRRMCSVGTDGIADDVDSCTEHCNDAAVENDLCEGCAIQECFNRLAEYEATNLTPDQMLALDKEFSAQAKELMQYKKIGTIEELRELETEELRGLELAQIAIAVRKSREYEAIGTVDECQEARERQVMNKPNIWGDGYDDEGNMIYDMYDCPNCGKSYEIDYEKYKFCPECGQAIDWGRKECENYDRE